MLCLRCCRCCWFFFCTVSCFMVLWPKFVRHFPKDAQNKRRREKQIKGAQSEYGESFSTTTKTTHTHTNRNTFVSVSMAWHLIESFNVMIGHRQHVNGFSIIFIEGNSVDDRTANWDYLGRMIGMGNRSVCDEIGRWNGNLNSEHRWI